jgi:hypothetical protein
VIEGVGGGLRDEKIGIDVANTGRLNGEEEEEGSIIFLN